MDNQEQLRRLEVERERGSYAQELLNNPEFQRIWTQIKDQIVSKIESTDGRDKDGAFLAAIALRLLASFKAAVTDSATTGKLARVQLESLTTIQRLKKALSIGSET